MDKKDFEQRLQQVNKSYQKRSEKEEKVWAGFDDEKSKLTIIVSDEFGKILDEIGPVISWKISRSPIDETNKAKVLDYKTFYIPRLKGFNIEITKIQMPKRVTSCKPSDYLGPITGWNGELHPKIRRFKEEYHVKDIENPKNNCDHK